MNKKKILNNKTLMSGAVGLKARSVSISPVIFTKKTNVNYKLVPFNVLVNDIGNTKYLPPVSKEWKNSVYNYNSNYNINYPVYDLKINELIKGYFNLYFNHKFLGHKYISRKSKRKSLNKIFVSKAEIKHTNNKAIITLYVYNRERISLLNRLSFLKEMLEVTENESMSNMSLDFGVLFQENLNEISEKWTKLLSEGSASDKSKSAILSDNIEAAQAKALNLSLLLQYKLPGKKSSLSLDKRYLRGNLKKIKKISSFLRKLRLRLSLNKYKFEDKFLYKLSLLISKYYGKKVEFNIVNLKSISYNSDIFTEILTLKMKKERSNPMRRINSLLAKVVVPKVNTIIERGRIEKQINVSINNDYKNNNLNEMINNLSVTYGSGDNNLKVYAESHKDNLNKLLYNIYYRTISILNNKGVIESNNSLNESYYKTLRDIIFENIKHKNMSGARLSVKGRLTRRYRADRAVYKLKWKGGLKNIDSSFKGLSTVVLRGYLGSNVEKSMLVSKRRIGSFAVKSWFSSK
jgi:hypothetical protein